MSDDTQTLILEIFPKLHQIFSYKLKGLTVTVLIFLNVLNYTSQTTDHCEGSRWQKRISNVYNQLSSIYKKKYVDVKTLPILEDNWIFGFYNTILNANSTERKLFKDFPPSRNPR